MINPQTVLADFSGSLVHFLWCDGTKQWLYLHWFTEGNTDKQQTDLVRHFLSGGGCEKQTEKLYLSLTNLFF